MQAGDIITRIDGVRIRHGVDVQLTLIDCEAGKELNVEFEREKKPQSAVVTLGTLELTAPVSAKVRPGLSVTAYLGSWTKIPDFAQERAVAQGTAPKPIAAISLPQNDAYGLRFAGFLQVPKDGLYTFHLRSDDGSRLKIDGHVVVDHDGPHAAVENSGLVRLKAGLHPLELDYFEASGEQALQLSWEGPELEKQEIPAAAFFSAAP